MKLKLDDNGYVKEVVIANSNNAKDLYSNLNRQLYCFPQLPNNY